MWRCFPDRRTCVCDWVLLWVVAMFCIPAFAMDTTSGKGQTQGAKPRADIQTAATAKRALPVRNAQRGKRTSKSTAAIRSRDDGKTKRKSTLTRRSPASAKAASARRAHPTLPEAQRERQLQLADECKQRLEAELQPAKIVKLAEECGSSFSADSLVREIRRSGDGARQALEVQRVAGLSADMFTHPEGDPDFQALIHKAARGDMDAAYRIANAYKAGGMGVPANLRRMEQWLRFSAELGEGRASWELAEHYNYGGLIVDAAKYEKRAEELGYRPGPRLPSRGY